jgi:class 3 adenylate cyclase
MEQPEEGPHAATEFEGLREQQRAIGRVLSAMTRGEGLEPVLAEVVESATLLSGAKNGRLWLLEDGLLRVVANCGWSESLDYDLEHPHLLDRTTMAGRTALTRQIVHVPDVDADPEYSYAGSDAFRSGLFAPIVFEDELIGVIGIVHEEVDPFDESAIELLKTFADQASLVMANARLLQAVERQKTELSRFVSPAVADLLASVDGERLLAGHRAYISIAFCDLRGFTAFSATAAPEELIEVLRGYHAMLGELISRHQGTLEHFAGDGVMVFFNDPVPVADPELEAVRFALAAHDRFEALSAGWQKVGIELGLGVGISAGHATLGRIGFEGRYDYGALGPDTSLASRLSTRATSGQTLIAQRVYAAVEERVEAASVGEFELKGFARPVPAYEVKGLRD